MTVTYRSDEPKRGSGFGVIYWARWPNGESEHARVGYIGKTVNWRIRLAAHRNATKSDTAFARALKKYGETGLRITFICGAEDDECLSLLEQECIALYGTKRPRGLNLTDGGDGATGYVPTEETRRKLSESHRGQSSHMKGKTHSTDTRRKLSDALKGRTRTPEAIAKGAASNRGKVFSEERRRNISEALMGKKLSEEHISKTRSANIGRKASGETRRKMSDAHRKLTDEQVSHIPILRRFGFSIDGIADLWNVGPRTVRNAIERTTNGRQTQTRR
jgi:hypothetical protein